MVQFWFIFYGRLIRCKELANERGVGELSLASGFVGSVLSLVNQARTMSGRKKLHSLSGGELHGK
jgi:hypothetical protein